MTAFAISEIPTSINTLEGLTAWAISAYQAAYGGKAYGERTSVDLQSYGRLSVIQVAGEENGTSNMLVGRLTVPLSDDIAAEAGPLWENVVEHSQSVSLPAGYKA